MKAGNFHVKVVEAGEVCAGCGDLIDNGQVAITCKVLDDERTEDMSFHSFDCISIGIAQQTRRLSQLSVLRRAARECASIEVRVANR